MDMELKDITKEAVTISEEATLEDVIRTMVERKTNVLLAINHNGELVGEVHVSDLLDAIVPEYLDGDSVAAHFATTEMFTEAVHKAREKKVSSFMTHSKDPIEATDGLMTVAATAIAQRRAHIPVIDSEHKPIGIISRRGLKHIIADVLNIPDSE